jgi:type II secretory pathway predicted ATPase ExeA
LYGLKHHPFQPDLPVEALWEPPCVQRFLSRAEALVETGGFALVTGEPGQGKSKVLQLLAQRLELPGEVTVAVLERPQSRLTDFYRELGERFAVNLSAANRYGGFKALRARWRTHIAETQQRPVLLLDECQEAPDDCLNELKVMSSHHFDSKSLLTVIFSGDLRFPQRLATRELLPLGTRIRARLNLEPWDRDALADFLDHALEQAGAPHLMTSELKATLCDHCAGNLRVLANLAADLLALGAERNLPRLDENLYIEMTAPAARPRPKRPAAAGREP